MTAADIAARPTLAEIEGWPAAVGVPEACRAIGISPSWGYQLVSQNEFPVRLVKVGSRHRVLTASLVALLRGEQ